MLDSGGSELFVASRNCWRLASVRRTRPHRFGGSGGILGRKTFLRGSTRDPQQFVARDFGPVKSTRDSSWKTLGFVLHANRQSDYGRGVALHTSLGCVGTLFTVPDCGRGTSLQTGLGGVGKTSSQHPNLGCGASSPLGYGCKRSNLSWTGLPP